MLCACPTAELYPQPPRFGCQQVKFKRFTKEKDYEISRQQGDEASKKRWAKCKVRQPNVKCGRVGRQHRSLPKTGHFKSKGSFTSQGMEGQLGRGNKGCLRRCGFSRRRRAGCCRHRSARQANPRAPAAQYERGADSRTGRGWRGLPPRGGARTEPCAVVGGPAWRRASGDWP